MPRYVLFIVVTAFLSLASFARANALEELPAGKVVADGSVAGEKEALSHFRIYEPEVYKKLIKLDSKKMRTSFGRQFVWFQRVGNYRKRQKCKSLRAIQVALGLTETNEKKCAADILETDDSHIDQAQ
ncbi:MAG: hypothetical protein ACXVB9_07820 [Bdellovibrionota bacterium]